jgi:hypothetical protein
MDTAMRLPIKVSSATSNFMIGVTAAASAGVYFMPGSIVTEVAGPVAVGSVLGTIIGARVLLFVSNDKLRLLFVVILVVLGARGRLLSFSAFEDRLPGRQCTQSRVVSPRTPSPRQRQSAALPSPVPHLTRWPRQALPAWWTAQIINEPGQRSPVPDVRVNKVFRPSAIRDFEQKVEAVTKLEAK